MVLGYLAIGFGFAGGIIEDGCDGFSTTVFPEILPFALTGVENELTTSSAASIPPMTTEHNAVFYGIETNDYKTLTPRFFGSFIEGYTPNELGLYGADVSDDAGIAYFNDKVNLYKSMYNFWKNKSS